MQELASLLELGLHARCFCRLSHECSTLEGRGTFLM